MEAPMVLLILAVFLHDGRARLRRQTANQSEQASSFQSHLNLTRDGLFSPIIPPRGTVVDIPLGENSTITQRLGEYPTWGGYRGQSPSVSPSSEPTRTTSLRVSHLNLTQNGLFSSIIPPRGMVLHVPWGRSLEIETRVGTWGGYRPVSSTTPPSPMNVSKDQDNLSESQSSERRGKAFGLDFFNVKTPLNMASNSFRTGVDTSVSFANIFTNLISGKPTRSGESVLNSTSKEPTQTQDSVVNSTSVEPTKTQESVVNSTSVEPTRTQDSVVNSTSGEPTNIQESVVNVTSEEPTQTQDSVVNSTAGEPTQAQESLNLSSVKPTQTQQVVKPIKDNWSSEEVHVNLSVTSSSKETNDEGVSWRSTTPVNITKNETAEVTVPSSTSKMSETVTKSPVEGNSQDTVEQSKIAQSTDDLEQSPVVPEVQSAVQNTTAPGNRSLLNTDAVKDAVMRMKQFNLQLPIIMAPYRRCEPGFRRDRGRCKRIF